MAFSNSFSVFIALNLLAGCATPPLALNANHPASPSAPEAATSPARATLRPDGDTLRTRELLAARARQAEDASAETPTDQPNPGPLKGTNHENH